MFNQTESSQKVKELFSNYSPQRVKIVAEMIENISDTYKLHHVSLHFDEVRHCQKGHFDIPQAIITNPVCDKGTGLLVFYQLRGLIYLYEKGVPLSHTAQISDKLVVKISKRHGYEYMRRELLNVLFEMIRNDGFNSSKIPFAPPIGRVEKSTMEKRFPNCPQVFLQPTPGENIAFSRVLI